LELISSALNAAWGGVERISALNAESQVGENSRLARREKSGKISGYYSGSGKTPKTPEKSKNKIAWKASQKFSKILNIIKRFLVKSVFRNSISFSK